MAFQVEGARSVGEVERIEQRGQLVVNNREPSALDRSTFKVEGRSVSDVERLEQGRQLVVNNREPSALDRLKNLVWIKKNTLYKEALEDWEREAKLKGERLVRREKRSEELTNQIYNVVGFFSVFQGVILTAVTQLTQTSTSQSTPTTSGCHCSRPLCGKVWFPTVLSVLAAIAAVIGIGLKFSDIHRVEVLILKERREQAEAIKRESDLRRNGKNFSFESLKDLGYKPLKSRSFLKSLVVTGAVVLFTVIFILSYFVILCDKWVIKGWD